MPKPAYLRFLPSFRWLVASVSLCPLLFSASPAAEPLHLRIDRHIESKLDFKPAPLAGDEEFLRRAYLDLIGKAPSVEQVRAFLEDKSTDKRTRLVDQLLDSPGYPLRMQYVFDLMLIERRSTGGIPVAQWREYLRQSFEDNKPYNQLAREILAADGGENRPAVAFYFARLGQLDTLTRDVGRLFMGMDVQCAQCHDHPIIEDYSQFDYYGISAFLNRSFLFNDPKQKKQFYAEKAEGEVGFKSVFVKSVDEKNFRPRLRGGKILDEPAFAKGQEYFVKPAKNVRPIPKFSRRQQLALMAADGKNVWFNTNIVNRLWHLMMGRGLVHPPGLQHAENPPSHPELLDELAREFAAMDFNVKAFLRELALTKTYARSSEIPDGMTDEQSAPERYAVASLRPLSPEQLTWSLMEAAGLADPIRVSTANRLDADPRLKEAYAVSAKARYLRDREIEQEVFKKLAGNVTQFANLYGGSPGEPEQDFQATVHQALFFANGNTIRGWTTALSGRLKNKDPQAIAEEIYLAVLSRRPTKEEKIEAVEHLLRKAENQAAGIQEIAWGLMASTEFRFNH